MSFCPGQRFMRQSHLRRRDLKITGVEIIQLGEPDNKVRALWASNTILLRLTTSNGEVGYGEAVPTLRVQPVIHALHEVERIYKGRDPLNVEANAHEWRKQDFYISASLESVSAASAFDIACWDIIGKHYGAPVHRLLGGEFRKRIPLYANGWYKGCVKPEDFAKSAKKWFGKGYRALKFDPFGTHYDYIDERGLRMAHERVRAVRDATEGKAQLLIEHHGRFNPNSAIMIAKRLREFDPLFFEEPIHPENVEGLRKYRAQTDVRIAVGERVLTKELATYLMSNHLTDFLQVDLLNFGGITEAKKVCAIAEALGVEMAFHNAFGPIHNAATLQVDASIPNLLLQESFYESFPQWKKDLVGSEPLIEGGYSAVPTKPGLGVDIDEEVIEAHRVQGQEFLDPKQPVWVVKDTWKD
jgi:L-alanine-DL-glutamate epimerase-like enolase superfamily enzyme